MSRFTLPFFILLLLMTPAAAQAQSYDDGLRAYQANDGSGALAVWQPLAEAGDPLSQYGLGKLYEVGLAPIAVDKEQAVFWYAKAAEQGIAAAQNNLGLMYAQGQGVPRDMNAALALWDSAGRGNHPQAQYNLGLSYYNGTGVRQSVETAAIWFGLAAENGLSQAQFAVGEMSRLGVGLPQDQARALGWYELAAAQGHREAASNAERLRASGVEPVEVIGSFDVSQLGPPPGEEGKPQELIPPPPPSRPGEEQTAEAQAPAEPSPQPTPDPAEAQAPEPPTPEPPSQAAEAQAPEPPTPEAPSQAAEAQVPEARTSATDQEVATSASLPPVPEVLAEQSAEQSAASSPEESAPTPPATSQQVAYLAPSGGPHRLWIGSLQQESAAAGFWQAFVERFPGLGAARLEVVRVELAGETFFRVLAASWGSAGEARQVCVGLRREDPTVFCQVLSD